MSEKKPKTMEKIEPIDIAYIWSSSREGGSPFNTEDEKDERALAFVLKAIQDKINEIIEQLNTITEGDFE